MTAFPTYSTGTVSIGAGATSIVGIGSNWTGVNAVAGDLIVAGGETVIIQDVIDATHLVIDAWPFTAVVAGAYSIKKNSPLRFVGGQSMQNVDKLIAAINSNGFYVAVPPTATEPDPSLGEENQYAIQAGTGKIWQRIGGAWVFVDALKGFGAFSAWSATIAYSERDVASLNGTSYVAIADNTNQMPPNAAFWVVLAAQGVKGDKGDKGDAATIAVGTTATTAAGTSATVTNVGTAAAAVFNFSIPKGLDGTGIGDMLKSHNPINVKDTPFGATGNGTTDDTAAIAAAIAATPVGGTLFFPTGNYLVSGSGSAFFTITNLIHVEGAGSGVQGGGGTTFLLAAGTPTTRDLFHIVGVTDTTIRGYSFKNFNVGTVSGSGGRHVFHFDTTAGTTTNFAEVLIDSVTMPTAVSAGGNSVFLNNGIGTNTNGGTFNFTIQNCFIGGGLKFLNAGDTLRVLNNVITGPNTGVICQQIAGAGQLIVSGNNITSSAGAIRVDQGISPVIVFNEVESGGTTEANNALVDITGDVASISSPKIINNQIQGISGTPTLIRIARAAGAFIDGNRLATASAYAHIVNTVDAIGTTVGAGNTFLGGGPNIADSGAATTDPLEQWTAYTPVAAATTGTFTASARFKQIGKTVYVNISVTYTSAATGTLTVTLPTTSLSNAVISGKEVATTGLGVAGFVLAGGNSMSVLTAAGGQILGSGSIIVLTGSYEAA
jgi:Pectate lyase superfamily protein